MERYLEGEEIGGEELTRALEQAVLRGEVFPVACAVATKNLGSTALLDLLVEGMPSPAEKGVPAGLDEVGVGAFVFKTIADPFAGRINVFRVVGGTAKSDSTLTNPRTRGKERFGQILLMQGKEHTAVDAVGEGDIAAIAKLKETMTGDALIDADRHVELHADRLPRAGDELCHRPQGEGRRGEDGRCAAPAGRGGSDAADAPRSADGRAAAFGHEPDARRGRGRAAQASLQRRGRAAPAARPLPRDDSQGGARARPLQEADRRSRAVRRLPHHRRAAGRRRRLRVRRPDRGRCHSAGFPAGGGQGHPGGAAARRAGRGAGEGRARAPRGRQLPHRRLVGDGVQDRRLDWPGSRPTSRPIRSCSSRSWRSR